MEKLNSTSSIAYTAHVLKERQRQEEQKKIKAAQAAHNATYHRFNNSDATGAPC
jgi:hypothetical protein